MRKCPKTDLVCSCNDTCLDAEPTLAPPLAPIDEEEMRSRGVHEKYLDAQEKWIRAIIREYTSANVSVAELAEGTKDARRRLMNVIFTGSE